MINRKSVTLGMLTTVLALSIALITPNEMQSGFGIENIKAVNMTNFSCTNEECLNVLSQIEGLKLDSDNIMSSLNTDLNFDQDMLKNIFNGQLPIDEEQFSQIDELIKSLLPR
ncbi:MAG: hypothetical protein DA328_05660 [Nitrososphaeraceae archaeon]|nr:hypothetical protein [Nitrososphaeraceae archaeon]